MIADRNVVAAVFEWAAPMAFSGRLLALDNLLLIILREPVHGATRPGWSSLGFAKTVVLPGFLIFLVPFLALCFFLHAERSFDAEARESLLKQIQANTNLSPEQRARALAFYQSVRFSALMTNSQFAEQVDRTVRLNYATFRWMIRLSVLSILASVAVLALAGLCVLLSLRSQGSQYLSLLIGWQVLRIYAALQTVVQGILLVALSYWVTALWTNRYLPQADLGRRVSGRRGHHRGREGDFQKE